MRLRFILATLLVLGLAAGDARAVDPPRPTPGSFRWAGEEFYFSVRLNGAEAMRASIRAGALDTGAKRAYIPISAVAQSVGFFRGIYPVDDRANTFVEPRHFRPLRSEKQFDERGKSRTYKVDYLAGQYRAEVTKKKTRRTYRFNYAIPAPTHDMLSWMYHLRARPGLAVGKHYTYFVYDGWKLSKVEMNVVEKNDVYTPLGWFKGWKITFVRHVMASRPQKDDAGHYVAPKLMMKTRRDHTGAIWLSRDENRLPIKVSIDTKFGTSEALLIKYKPHHH